eukprot:jgi/Psemu1/305003/fgenesh1_kg.178_\
MRTNKKGDPNERDVTDDELREIDRLLSTYDCDVWKYLQPYISKGTLRFLYPSKTLFAACNNRDDGDGDGEEEEEEEPPPLSFPEVVVRIKALVEGKGPLEEAAPP